MNRNGNIVVLGVFAADATWRADRAPRMGETVLGNGFSLGPGGKGSNQAVAAARLGGAVTLITRLGDDAFAELAYKTWREAGVHSAARSDPSSHTGAACIFIEQASGENAIIIYPGAAGGLGAADIDANQDLIRNAAVFITQLEQPVPVARQGLALARSGGAVTVLNPAPATALDDELFALCDYVTPNEAEARALTGMPVTNIEEARLAAGALLERGAGGVVITLGEQGAMLRTKDRHVHIPAFKVGPITETTGAGDAFNGGFATALARGFGPVEAVRLGCAAAAISVTRPGAAASMPTMAEIEHLL